MRYVKIDDEVNAVLEGILLSGIADNENDAMRIMANSYLERQNLKSKKDFNRVEKIAMLSLKSKNK
ncbi:hypothetical protein DY123_07335 [Apilactobacillus micheneri]|uniref:hypothetical protein n=1 Tax=Apilactobacillus micheneri TaxID=1899430 RepID=UPI00112C172F|nr:hypothetical protein [Apilactobacillus micheneri]TPR41294.1 hypothetical protein DY123_07335 [Apilactobacillus micheneri]